MDAGYQGLQNFHLAILPFSDLKESDPWYAAKQAFNFEFASHRIVVENVFARIKNWNVCSYPF